MSLAAETAAKHPLGWRVGTRLAVFLVMMAAIIAGHIMSGDAFAGFGSTVGVWINWALLQVICVLVGMGWSTASKSPTMRRIKLVARRKWLSVRRRLRRRWAEARSRKFTHWEEDALFMACVLAGVGAIIFIPPLPFILFFVAIFIVILLINAPLYRDAPNNLEGMMSRATFLGFTMGYAV